MPQFALITSPPYLTIKACPERVSAKPEVVEWGFQARPAKAGVFRGNKTYRIHKILYNILNNQRLILSLPSSCSDLFLTAQRSLFYN